MANAAASVRARGAGPSTLAVKPSALAGEPSALAVQANLLAHDLVAEARAQVVLEAVRQRDNHVLHAAVFDELGQELAALGAVVFPQEIANHVEREVTGEVKYRVIEQVSDKLFHRDTSKDLLGKKDGVAHIADKLTAQGLRTID